MGDRIWRRVAKVEEVTGNGPYALSAGDVDVVMVRTPSGALKAYDGLCPHRGALLGEGELHGEHLVCRNHRWRFDRTTGKRDGGEECLAACDVRETDGEVHVDVAALIRKRETKAVARRRVDDLPGPRALPLIGNVHQLDPTELHLQLEEWARVHGTPFRYRFGPKDVVVFADIDEMLPVLRDRPDTFRRASNLEPVFRELGVAGVFSAEGKAWRPQRRLSMEALSHRHLRGLYPTLGVIASRLRNRWLKAAERGDTLDLADELKRFTVDVTTQLVLGHDIDTLGTDGGVIQDKLSLLFPAFNRRLFSLVPYWRLVRLPRDRAVDRAVAELREWVGTLARDARARMDADPELAARPANFLEAMIVARDENGEPFDEHTIFGNVLTMLLAGEDTTAHTLAWSIHHLIDAPSDVAALRDELDRTMGDDDVPRDIDTANRLSYAGAIANEAMRLRPVAPAMFFEPLVDTVIGDVDIPKGTFITLLLRPPAVSKDAFAAPNEFRPARWIDAAARDGAHEPSAHQPFGSGPRICPGRTLALLEMKLVLATIYRSFDVERVGRAADVREAFSFTMMPEGLQVRVRRAAARTKVSAADAPAA